MRIEKCLSVFLTVNLFVFVSAFFVYAETAQESPDVAWLVPNKPTQIQLAKAFLNLPKPSNLIPAPQRHTINAARLM